MVSRQTREQALAQRLSYFHKLHRDVEKAFELYNKAEESLTWFIKGLGKEELEKSVQYSVEHLLKEGVPRGDIQYLFYWMIREGGQRLDGELKRFAEEYRISVAEAFPRFIADF
jgi:hypothetical protein